MPNANTRDYNNCHEYYLLSYCDAHFGILIFISLALVLLITTDQFFKQPH